MKILILAINCLFFSLVSNADDSPSSSRDLQQYALSIYNENSYNKILSFSRYFISKPYNMEIGNNLIIWDETRNKIDLINIDNFDCLSYVETVLALSKIQNPDTDLEKFIIQLADNLVEIMFSSDSNDINYSNRNHFMDEWLKSNKNIIGENAFKNLNYAKLKMARINKSSLLQKQLTNYADKLLNDSQHEQLIVKYNNLINKPAPYESSIKYISFSDFLLNEKELVQNLQGKIYLITIIVNNPKLLRINGLRA